MLCALALALAVAAPDERIVLQAPNIFGNQGLVRSTSALVGATGTASLGLSSRLFFTPDFVLVDVADANTFVEGNVVAGVGFFEVLELSLQSRAAANLNTARAQPSTSIGDTTLSLKGGYQLGVVAAAATVRLALPTRSNKVGFDFGNIGTGFLGVVTVDLLALHVPVRVHLNGGYILQTARFAEADAQKNPFFLDGPDGALLALSAQQWFFDQATVGLGVEVPLPYVTPFIELWYQAALGATDYDFGGDASIIATPGLRVGFGGLRVDLAADIGLGGTAGGGIAAEVVDGQPLTPVFAARIAAEPQARLEYATLCDPDSLESVARVDSPVQLAVAVWVGGVRLIDNVRLDPASGAPEPIARNTSNASPSRTATLPESAEAC